MCRCGPYPQSSGVKRTLLQRISEWMFGKPQDNERRAIKYFRAQLCQLGAHSPVSGPAPNVERCEWCEKLMHAREKDIIGEFRAGLRQAWSKKIDDDMLGLVSRPSAGLRATFIHADEPPEFGKLHVRRRVGPAQTISAMRGWKMSSDEADRILRELVKRAPQDWAAGGPPITKKKKPRRGR